jgi:hypothetical protein
MVTTFEEKYDISIEFKNAKWSTIETNRTEENLIGHLHNLIKKLRHKLFLANINRNLIS